MKKKLLDATVIVTEEPWTGSSESVNLTVEVQLQPAEVLDAKPGEITQIIPPEKFGREARNVVVRRIDAESYDRILAALIDAVALLLHEKSKERSA